MAEPLADWATALTRKHLGHLDQRWRHTLGVVDRARELARILPPSEHEFLVAAAYLHDIGYAPWFVRTGFHPLDGARYLQALGQERLACLVAFHSGARAEAEERGLARELAAFREENSLVARALTYCDLVTCPDGNRVSLEARLAHVAERYDAGSAVGQAVSCSAAGFREIVHEIEGLLAKASVSAVLRH